MARKIFVNLPIRDMERSKAFFGALGFSFNPQFTNEQGACMVISEDIFVMLLVEPFFQTFTKKPIADATQDHRGAGLPVVREPRRGGRAGEEGAGRRRHRAQRAAGPRLHVRPRLRGPGRPRLGAGVDGPAATPPQA